MYRCHIFAPHTLNKIILRKRREFRKPHIISPQSYYSIANYYIHEGRDQKEGHGLAEQQIYYMYIKCNLQR
jgi:hypothetical protein